MQSSGVSASLRGIYAVTAKVVWASGAGGTYLITNDSGVTWRAAKVPTAEALDFRGVQAFSARAAWLMSAGPGAQSRIYRTTDGGAHWPLQLTNPDAAGFFDAMRFWDSRHGIILGDAVDGRFTIFTTSDAGAHWSRETGPPALANEGAFAASNSCLAVNGTREAWFGTSVGRVFHSKDGGRTWTTAAAPAVGSFSLAFAGPLGIAVGGDYTAPANPAHNVAVTTDAGGTWTVPAQSPTGYRSAVHYLAGRHAWIAVGTTGSDISSDNGQHWRNFETGSFNALSSAGDAAWAVGPDGRIAILRCLH